MSKRIRLFLTGIFVLGGLAWAVHYFSRQPLWQDFQSFSFRETIASVRLSYLGLAMLLIFATYMLRAFRWQAFLRHEKKTSLRNVLVSTVIGFSVVALTGRPGELVRPMLIARKEGLAVTSQLGVWMIERVFDSLTILGLIGMALWWRPPAVVSGSPGAAMLAHFRQAGLILFFITLLITVFVLLLHHYPKQTARLVDRLLTPFPLAFREKVDRWVEHFASALGVVKDFPGLLLCMVYSLLVWLAILGAYWSVALAMGPPMSQLAGPALALVMVAGVVGSVVHLPAVGGGTQVATILTLQQLFGIPLPAATTMALLIWLLTYMLVLVPGIPLAAREGLTWQNWRLARTES